MKITILIVDDHSIVSEGIKALLESHPQICVVGTAVNGREALMKIKKLKPQIVIMDITMPSMNGIDTLRRISSEFPGIKVLMLSMHANWEYIYRALNAGARGYILKEAAGVELIDGVLAVHNGGRYLSTRARELYNETGGDLYSNPLDTLSQREREVLQLTVEGKTSAEIADILFLSSKSVETYRSRLMRKLNLENLPELVKFAIHHGLTPLE